MHLTVLAWAAAVALVARILFPFLRAVSSPLRDVPGPVVARFTNLWYLWRVKRGSFENDNLELHRKHGEIVRYGANRYSFSSPSAQKIIYGHGTKFPKSSWYATWQNPHPDQWSLFADQSISRHSENRRQYQSAYTMSSLVSYESYVDECADLFSQRLQEVASAGAYADMGHWLQCYAFDVIGMITFSKRLGFLDKGEDIRGILAALEDLLWYATLTGIYSWLHKYHGLCIKYDRRFRHFEALRQEVDERQREGRIGHYITFKESQDMPYLQAVMKEALRMHPATGLPLERVVPAEGATICDRFFPEGTIVGINSWVAHRDTSVFGPDANMFRPERWLDADKEKLSLMERSWMPFGLGSRTCIGRHISQLEMSKLIPMLVRDFDFSLAPHLQAADWQTTNYWFVKPRDFQVKVMIRQQDR